MEDLVLNYNLEELKQKVYDKLKSSNNPRFENRYVHSLGVSRCAGELARIYDEKNIEKAVVAGLVHDYCKFFTIEEYQEVINKHSLDITLNPNYLHVYHSILAPYVIRDELKITDEDILNAIKYHQMGKPQMSTLEMIVYVSDEAEETRVGDVFKEARKIAFEDLNRGVAFVSKVNIEYLLRRNASIYPSSIETYNYYCKYLNKERKQEWKKKIKKKKF